MAVIAKKQFPDGFPNDVTDILKAMSFTDGKELHIVGSMSLRSQLYAGDYDAIEYIPTAGTREHAVDNLVRKFKKIVKDVESIPNTTIADIKSGSVEEWVIITDPYNYKFSVSQLEKLYSEGIIDKNTYDDGKRRIKPRVSRYELLSLMRDFRPNIIRWTPRDVLLGYKKLIDGRKFTLHEAFVTPVITKLDVISWVQNNRFTDFSVIYQFKSLNATISNIEHAIMDNILMLHREGNYFKMAKRMFSLAKYRNELPKLEKLSALFNGDIGRLYMIYGDIGTLESLFEQPNIPYAKIDFEVDQFKGRLSNISLKKYLSQESYIFGLIDNLKNKEQMLSTLIKIRETLYDIMTHYAKLYLEKVKLI
jgi:hypothetical protein